jgi:hypothetical protein
MPMRNQVTSIGLAAVLHAGTAIPAHAACPQELAVYSDADTLLTLEFSPNGGRSAMAVNFLRVVMQNGIVLDGKVIWNVGIPRPNGELLHECPAENATQEEMAACTIWSGVVYGVDAQGKIDLLPMEGDAAAEQILLPDFGRAVRYSRIWGDGGVSVVPWDVLTLSGCQE